MNPIYLFVCILISAASFAIADGDGGAHAVGEEASVVSQTPVTVYRVEIKGEINHTQEYIVRRALKEAIQNDVNHVVMEMDTPGGNGENMFNIMEMIHRFPGKIITYVNDEAVSAGALIAFVSDEVYFVPTAVIGASAPVTATGGEINPTLQAKLLSYIRARIRALKDGDPLAANVLEAMVDINYELVVDGQVICPKGELLTLSAGEASKFYMDPPRRLFGNGIVENLDDLLQQSLNGQPFQVVHFEKTWSEQLALYTNAIAPILFGIGFLLIVLELKTGGGFGLAGIVGGGLILLTLVGQNAAGMAGYESILVIVIGMVLLGLELFVLPGTLVFGVLGLIMVFGGLVYAMADIWPEGAVNSEITLDLFLIPIRDALIAFLVGGIGIFLFLLRLPNTRLGRKFVLQTNVGSGDALAATESGKQTDSILLGKTGVVVTPLHPEGEVIVEGKRYVARSYEPVESGVQVRVVREFAFGLEVEAIR